MRRIMPEVCGASLLSRYLRTVESQPRDPGSCTLHVIASIIEACLWLMACRVWMSTGQACFSLRTCPDCVTRETVSLSEARCEDDASAGMHIARGHLQGRFQAEQGVAEEELAVLLVGGLLQASIQECRLVGLSPGNLLQPHLPQHATM